MARLAERSALVFFLLLVACSGHATDTVSTASSVDADQSSTIPCPVSPAMSMRTDIAPVAGGFPIWVTALRGVPWTNFLSAGAGKMQGYRWAKQVWVIDTRAQGDLKVIGHRLRGGGDVLFSWRPYGIGSTPLKTMSIPAANAQSEQSPIVSPSGFQDHEVATYYPGPGCYQFTATMISSTVVIVLEVANA